MRLSSTNIGNFLAFGIFFSASIIGHNLQSIDWFTAIPGYIVDPRLNSIFLEHLYGWVTGRWDKLWSPIYFYPFQNTLGLSDNHFGSGLIYVLFRAIGFNREIAMSSWIFMGGLLNFLSCFFVLKKLGFQTFSASAGAFIFASSLPTLGAPDHAQLVYRMAIPIAFYYSWKFFTTGDLKNFGWAMVWIAEQFLCSIYLGTFLVYLLVLFGLIFLAFDGRLFILKIIEHAKKETIFTHIKSLCLIAIGTSIIVLLLFKYHQVATEFDLRWPQNEIDANLATVTSYFWFGSFFLGVGLTLILLLSILAIWLKRIPHQYLVLGKVSSIAFFVLLLLVIKIGNFSLYYALLNIPGISALRGMYRVIFPDLILAAIMVAILLEFIYHKIHKKMIYLYLPIIVGGALCIETITSPKLIYRTPHAVWQDRIADVSKLLNVTISVDSVLNIKQNFLRENALTELDAMILSQDLGVPTLNGFSGHSTPGYIFNPCFSSDDKLNAFLKFRPNSKRQVDLIRNNIIELDANIILDNIVNESTILASEEIFFSKNIRYKNVYWPPLLCGWTTPESWGNWSDGPKAKIALPLPLSRAKYLEFKLYGLVDVKHPKQEFSIGFNDMTAENFVIDKPGIHSVIVKIPEQLTYKNFILVDFKFFNPISPREIGINDDERKLAIGIVSATFK